MPDIIHKEKPDFRKKLHDVPHRPGVYLMRDRFNRVIYVGKARDLRKRVANYFIASKQTAADPKTRALIESIWDFEIHTVRSEPEALLLEGRLIKEFRPKYNVSFRDDKRFLLVKVDAREAWPRFRFARIKKDDGARYFGPYANAGALRETVQFMRKKFGVLTFGRGAPSAKELKYSSYQVPSRLSDVTAEQYRERIAAACAFLAGETPELLEQLDNEMRAAAAKLDFERAAELRGLLEDFRETMKPVRRFTRHSLPGAIDPAADLRALQDALRLPAAPAVMECFDISNISATHVVASMVCFRNGLPDRDSYRRYRIKTVGGQDDFASMAEVVRRRYARVLLEMRNAECGMRNELVGGTADYSPEHSQENALEIARRLETKNIPHSALRIPHLIIVDGGKGQLSSACRELQRLGLHDIPVIGLAKEFEEIYRPLQPLPLRLPENSGALRLLQRIRDEAHRVANGYHQLLMKRRIAESLLDDCPGVSENRKQILLKKFGSVARLRKAGAEQIAATEGIGAKLAAQIAAFLAERS